MYNGDQWAKYRRMGQVFIVDHRVTAFAAGGVNDILIRVPETSSISALIQAEIADYADFYMYENPSLNNNGHQLTPHNMNRSHSDETDVLFSHSPDVSGLGTLIHHEFALAWLGHFNDGTAVWELKKGDVYLLRAQNMHEDTAYLKWRIVFRKITIEDRIT